MGAGGEKKNGTLTLLAWGSSTEAHLIPKHDALGIVSTSLGFSVKKKKIFPLCEKFKKILRSQKIV